MADDQKFRHIPGRGNVPIHDPQENGGNNGVVIGVAVTIVLSALAGAA